MENINTSKIRVRIAPSPTGFVHVGNLRTVLYNYLFARHYEATFIVRIEDTDQNRFTEGATEDFLRTLEWAGLDYDEGPVLKNNKIKEVGEFGPYFQSQRLDIYQNQIKHLLDKHKAYYCFCTKKRIDELRDQQRKDKLPPKYDGCCRKLNKEEIQKRLDSGENYVIRFKMPESKDVIFEDEIRGSIVVNTKDLDDYVLIKSDGFPTYHFANVIDDHLMKITHVLRGEEWIASTPKHILLYEAFSWHPPVFAHLPQILNEQGKKMSKRHDKDVSVKDFIDKGYLKEALLNFISLLGWNSGTEQDIFSMEELKKQFTLDRVHKSGAIFDLEKLDWINGMYLRELSLDKFTEACLPFLEQAKLVKPEGQDFLIIETNEKIKKSQLKKYLELAQSRIKKLTEVGELTEIYFKPLKYKPEVLVWRKSDAETTKKVLKKLLTLFKSFKKEDFNLTKIEAELKAFIENENLDNGSVLWPLRTALSGKEKSPGPFELASVLGKEKIIERLKIAIDSF